MKGKTLQANLFMEVNTSLSVQSQFLCYAATELACAMEPQWKICFNEVPAQRIASH